MNNYVFSSGADPRTVAFLQADTVEEVRRIHNSTNHNNNNHISNCYDYYNINDINGPCQVTPGTSGLTALPPGNRDSIWNF